MTKNLYKKELVNRINYLRHSMIKIATNKGLNNHETLKQSQELDKLIVKYQFLLIEDLNE